MANFKTEATAFEIADELARRTGLPAVWGYVGGIPSIRLGEATLKNGGGVLIQIQDQRGEGDGNWDALPGFGTSPQPVFTTGVAKIVSEALVNVSAAAAYASGTLTLTNPTPLDNAVVINGVTFTAGVDFTPGATDDTSALALANAINAHPKLKNVVVATYTQGGGGGNSTVVVTARFPGATGNLIDTTETATAAAWGAGTLTGGAGTSNGSVLALGTDMKIWAAIAKRGLKIEIWQTAVGTPPMSDFSTANTSYFQAEFFPNEFWPLQGLV